MSYAISDDDSTDSESGIRFKTESTRKLSNDITLRKSEHLSNRRNPNDRSYDSQRSSYSSRSDRRHGDRSRDRKHSGDRHKMSRSTSRDRKKYICKPRKKDSENSKDYRNDSNVKKYEDKNSSNFTLTERDGLEKSRLKLRREEEDKPLVYDSVSPTTKLKTSKELRYKKETQNNEDELKERPKSKVDESFSRYLNKPKKSLESEYGPTLPLSKNKIENPDLYGPKIHSKLNQNTEKSINISESSSSDSELQNNSYEPSLPPKLSICTEKNEIASSEINIFGPALPPHLQKNNSKNELTSKNEKTKIMGPSLPPHLRDKLLKESEVMPKDILTTENNQETDSDDEMIGPLPEGHVSSNISHKLLEERALEMKINSLTPSESAPKIREEWMTQLPDVRTARNLGLGPRQFRSKAGPDLSDRSSWTDTPEDKETKIQKGEEKVDIKKKSKLDFIAKRDKEQEEIVSKHKKKKKRDKALIELHQEKLAKKKKEESSMPQERRPFDRDIDLKVNRFDDAQKKAILKKAQLLDTRFSTGESKFL